MIGSLAKHILYVSVVVSLTACSMFSRKSVDPVPATGDTAATPLDMPAPPPDGAAPIEKTNDSGPTVTLVKKGTNEPIAQKGEPHTNMWSKTWSENADPAHASAPHWGYAGETGPEHWASLNKEYGECGAGKNQSPIDLKWRKPQKPHPLSFNYKMTSVHVENNGHTVMVGFEAGNFVKANGDKWELMQAHFHTPSEHTFSGKGRAMEIHFVHKNDKGALLVLGVVVEPGKANPTIEKIWNAIPKDKNLASEPTLAIKPDVLMPPTKTYYTYSGSLTTPPCTENVTWMVFNAPVRMSAEQIAAFQKLYAVNARPVQPTNDRKVLNF